MSFQLSPEITFSKQRLPGCWAYVFRHQEMGELGRILLQGAEGDQTQLSCEVAGDPKDQMTQKRLEILKPLSLEICRQMENRTGPGIPVPKPELPRPNKALVESKVMQCLHCDAFVAELIFAPDADTPDKLEDYARLMYPKYSVRNLPTWVIGSPQAIEPGPETPAYILKVWPSREPVRCLRPDEFNPEVEKLQEAHCASK